MLDQVLNSSSGFNLQTPAILLVLIALEAVLSADNAIALAAIAQGLGDKKQQKLALNIGLVFAYILRIILILTATWVVQFWQFELLGAIYLLWLVLQCCVDTATRCVVAVYLIVIFIEGVLDRNNSPEPIIEFIR